jgi:hypothetical protein
VHSCTQLHVGSLYLSLMSSWEKGGGGLWRAGDCGETTIIGHGEDWDLCDGSTPALHTACSFIDGGQVCVHVSREASAPGHFLSGSGDLQYP